MRSPLQSSVALLGRILLSSAFLMLAALKVAEWNETQEFMTARGMRAVGFWAVAAVLVELVAGACLLLGFETRIAALALMAYLVPVSLVLHNFWALQGVERITALQQFMQNVAIMGGLLMVAVYGGGACSLDALDTHRRASGWLFGRRKPGQGGAQAHPPAPAAR